MFVLSIISSKLLGNEEKFSIRPIEPTSEIQKELVISEMETKLNHEIGNSNILYNKIFLLEKQIAALKCLKNSTDTTESSFKRPRTDQVTDEPAGNNSDFVNQELSTKFKVVSVELDELRKISGARLKELETFRSENKRLFEELELKKDQVCLLKLCCY